MSVIQHEGDSQKSALDRFAVEARKHDYSWPAFAKGIREGRGRDENRGIIT